MTELVRSEERLKEAVLDRLARGDTLLDICDTHGAPGTALIARWRRDDPDFEQSFQLAMQGRALRYAEDIVTIADHAGETVQVDMDADGRFTTRVVVTNETIARDRLRIDTRKWLAERYYARAFGATTRHEHMGEGGGPMKLLIGPTAEAYEAAQRSRLEKA